MIQQHPIETISTINPKEDGEPKSGVGKPASILGSPGIFLRCRRRYEKPDPRRPRIREKVFCDNKPWEFHRLLAKQYGIPFAIVIKFLDQVLRKINAKNRNGGSSGFVGSPEYMRNLLPFLSEHQILLALRVGRKLGIIKATKLSDKGNAGLSYELDYTALRAEGWKRKADAGDTLSVLPQDVRDYDLHTAMLMEYLRWQCKISFTHELKRGDRLSQPSRKELAKLLPISINKLGSAIRELERIGFLLRKDPAPDRRSKPTAATLGDRISLLPAAGPAPEDCLPLEGEQFTRRLKRVEDAMADGLTNEDQAPEWKARNLLEALRASSRCGVISRSTWRTFKANLQFADRDEHAATVFFEHNPKYLPDFILETMTTCARIAVEVPLDKKQGFDPIWHIRRATRLGNLFRNWDAVHAQLQERGEVCFPHMDVRVPPESAMYPMLRRAEVGPTTPSQHFYPASPEPTATETCVGDFDI